MSGKRSAAQKRAIAAAIARKKSSEYRGYGGYRKTTRRTTIRGRGDYKKDYGSRLGSVVGEGLQELLTQLGGIVGIGKAVSGMGSYAPHGFTVKQNKLAEGNDPPEVVNGNEGSFIIRHREYIKDIHCAADGAFTNETLNINPGNRTLFPWLAEVASRFEQYRVEGMVFEFRSNYGEATTGSLGTVIMATEYEVNKPDFSSKVQMENHQYAASCKPSLSMLHPIECARNVTPLTELCVRVSSDGSHSANDDEDPRFCDLAKFQIASVGVGTTAVNLGELWCSYQIRFLKPRLDLESDTLSFWYHNDTDVTTTTPFGTVASALVSENNNLAMEVVAEGVIRFPRGARGTYQVLGWWSHTSAVVGTPSYTGALGLAVEADNDPFDSDGNTVNLAPQGAATATRRMRVFSFTLDPDYEGQAQVQIQSGGNVAAGNVMLYVSQMPDGLGVTSVPAPLLMKAYKEQQKLREIKRESSSFTQTPTPKVEEDSDEESDYEDDVLYDPDILSETDQQQYFSLLRKIKENREAKRLTRQAQKASLQTQGNWTTPNPQTVKEVAVVATSQGSQDGFLSGNYTPEQLIGIAEEMRRQIPCEVKPQPASTDALKTRSVEDMSFEELLQHVKSRAREQLSNNKTS
jgi:hypothetical protein